MKKICFVKYDMMDASGGARVCANLANALCSDYEVHVVSICSLSDNTFYELDERVIHTVLIKGEARIRETLPKGIKRLRRYIKNSRIDVAFSVGVSINPFLMLAARGTSCKAVSCEHINSINRYGNDIGQRLCRWLGAKFGNGIITLTEKDREAYLKRYKLDEKKVRYIYNWMDEDLLSGEVNYNCESKRIISAVRIEPVKGVENIIEVSKKLKIEFPDWQWHIYGGGEENYIEGLKTKISDCGLEDFVVFRGKVGNLYQLYSDYSIFALTSYNEGLPMVLIEAKAKKLPSVCFDCATGPSDIIRNGVDGYLVPVGDIDCLYEKLSNLMRSKELREEMSSNTYGNIELFSKETILKKWKAYLEEI